MGTYAHYYYYGNLIPEKKEEYVQRALKIFHYGGLMGLEGIKQQGLHWALLNPYPKFSRGYDYTFSYFEREGWENAILNPQTGDFKTEKVGYSIFGQVCYAVYLLREFYEEIPGIAGMVGTSPCVEECLGWMNYLLHENLDNSRIYRIQELYRRYPDWCNGYYENEDHPTWQEYDACMASAAGAPRKIDPELYHLMSWEDGVCSCLYGLPSLEVRPVCTIDFLNQTTSETNRRIEEQGIEEITQEDRLFWWEPGGDVTISKAMGEWLRKIRERYRLALGEDRDTDVLSDLKDMIRVGNCNLRRPFLFTTIYQEFAANPSDQRVKAATNLLQAILDTALEDKRPMQLDQYCAVLANKRLRKRVLGF